MLEQFEGSAPGALAQNPHLTINLNPTDSPYERESHEGQVTASRSEIGQNLICPVMIHLRPRQDE